MRRILCFGDSNTYGHNPKDMTRIERRWTRLLPEILGDGYEIIEEGLCSRTTVFKSGTDPESRVGSAMLEPIIATHKPFDLLVIMLGTNDLLLGCKADLKDSAAGLDTLIRIAKDAYPGIKILIVSPIEVSPAVEKSEIFAPLYGGIRAADMSKQFSKYYCEVAKKHDCCFMDAALCASASPLDGIHMDEENHKKIAAAIATKIQSIF